MRTAIDDSDLRDVLVRLHVARWSGILPPDLGDALLDLVGSLESRTQRRQDRDRWLRRAGRYWSGSAWIRAGRVFDEMHAQVRRPISETLDPHTFRGAVRAALLIDFRAPSRKQIARVLEVDTSI